MAGLSRPGVSKVDFEKTSRAVITRKEQLATIDLPGKKRKEKTFLEIRTHVCGFQTQVTKPLGHQNCKWRPILSIVACFTGKTVELSNAVGFKEFFHD